MSKEPQPVPEAEIKKQMKSDYPLIPMGDITTEARLLAVAWVDGYEPQGMDIPGKQKLASDIMNYARRHAAALEKTIEEQKKEIERLKELMERVVRQNHVIYRNQNSSMTESQVAEEVELIWGHFKSKHNL